MSELIATSARCAIVGMGQTGHSLARYCSSQGIAFDLFDSRQAPPLAALLAAEFPDAKCYTGGFDGEQLSQNIDGITGATLSVRAVNAVAKLALFYAQQLAPS